MLSSGARADEGRGWWLAVALGVVLAIGSLSSQAAAEPSEGAPKAVAVEGDVSPKVGLDTLLRLPSGFEARADHKRGGAVESEWRRRFAEAEGELQEVRAKLAKARAEYDATASESEQWQVAPPGATNPQTSPLSFRLKEEMRKLREELDRSESRRRDLEIEANLASVPAEWRR